MKFSDRGATIDVHVRLDPGSRPSRARAVSLDDQPEELSVGSDRAESPLPSPAPTVLVTVEDTGIGLSDEAKRTVFSTTQQVRDSGGTGLGLYSLAKRIEALGGKYGVKNRSDGKQGSLFWFSFPYQPGVGSSMGVVSLIASPIGCQGR